ncbi:MAG: cardiolipin synthase B [Gemmatimonadetes bacterium]|nr:cardiolipin synthase B [Gemmatimonadota bacterium]
MTLRSGVVGSLAAIGAGSLVWVLYALVTPETTDELPRSLSGSPRGADGRVAEVLAAHLGEPVVSGNLVLPLHNGDQIFPEMLDAIRGARESITFLTFIYWEGDIAREFAAALSEAGRRGVEVRVLLDAYGGRRMDPALVDQMREAGCRVAWFHPLHWYTLRRYNNRTHRRALVVDGRVGFTGGVGIGSEWTGDAQGPGHWRDDHFRVEGPVVRSIQGAFAENWREATGEALAGDRLFPEIEAAGEALVVPVLEIPGGSVSRTGMLYWTMLQVARERVRIWAPYFVPDPDLLAAIVETAERGVTVELLVPGDHNDSELVRHASQTFYAELLAAGVQIHEYRPTMMHVKAVLVDDLWTLVGTANFDNRSFELNYEIVLAVRDAALNSHMSRSFDRDLTRAERITGEDVEAWSPLERLRDHAYAMLREQI